VGELGYLAFATATTPNVYTFEKRETYVMDADLCKPKFA
jgi:hypothetical protein